MNEIKRIGVDLGKRVFHGSARPAASRNTHLAQSPSRAGSHRINQPAGVADGPGHTETRSASHHCPQGSSPRT